jgi:AcrR family transcriptional regulator
MSPRPYRAGERRLAATEATRSKIVTAVRDLLTDPGTTTFSIDAVADRADVNRMTVYYQFKSKRKLLEAVFDDVATRANMRDMRKVFPETDPDKSLSLLIEIFCNLWKTQGALLRRLNALAALDPDVNTALTERGDWRREALTNLAGRFSNHRAHHWLVDLLQTLTSFETYEMLSAHNKPKEIVELLKWAAATLVRSTATPTGRQLH